MGYSFKILAFFVLSNFLSISTATRAIEPECGSCSKPPVTPVVPLPPVTGPKLPVPPVTVPPVIVPVPPVTVPPVIVPVPPVTVPPVTVPKVPVPPVTVPKVPVVGVVPLPPVTLPPISVPNLPLPPVVTTTPKKGKPCPPPAHKKATCPVNTLKLGVCASVLGGKVSIGLGDPGVNKCCTIISGFADAEAAACLCTTLKIKTLNLKIYVPVALQLLVTCGKTPPPGYTCAV
ncbi:uncharacterized protein LOC142505267 [Primulina tabacum]|uniref:uncharacterized protein LOC142505267 n=1 Tax=Primulina tabacum TaxID=48773 RepID=UPI003F5A5090